MQCPNCEAQALRPVLTRQGVEVDFCDRCSGVWLDKGEIFHFVGKPKQVAEKLERAVTAAPVGGRLSPMTGQPMRAGSYDGVAPFDYCPESGGLWFDAEAMARLLDHERNIHLEVDAAARRPKTKDPAEAERQRHQRIRAGLLPLPNLFVRSTITLAGLYGVLIAVLIAAVEFAGVRLETAVAIGIAIVLFQFALGPFLMDLSLRFMYRMEWVESDRLPGHLKDFVERVCQRKKIKFPRFGIIDDGAPQAFTYGHTPNNARIVISRGILELLEPEEVEAVVAHEIGHAVHWDMALMTIAQLVPLVMYFIYRTLIRMRTSGRDRSAAARMAIAAGAYVLYIISQYLVLWFSRTREYHADRFAGEVTGQPSRLASALVKIAYGLAGQSKEGSKGGDEARSPNLEAIGAMGIFDAGSAKAMAVAGYPRQAAQPGEVSAQHVQEAMRWDLWNPWARWYELNSTHPLVASRLRYLSDQAVALDREPYVVFDQTRPESYWDEFFVDLSIYLLPIVAVLSVPVQYLWLGSHAHTVVPLAVGLIALGGALLARFHFSYRGGYFAAMSVSALLKRVKVSAVRPVPCKIKGTIVGRGVPGYILSEDFVLKDETGIIFLDYRQPLALWNLLFGLLKAGRYEGQEVEVEGWYRRAPVPYIELKRIKAADGTQSRSWVPALYRLSALALMAAGFVWLLNA